MSRRRICSHILILTALVLILSLSYGSSPAQADPPLYLVDTPFSDVHSWIYQVDPATGALQVRADMGTAYSPVLGMAAASSTILYLTGTDTSPSQACQGDVSCLLLRVELDPLSTLPVLVQIVGTVTEGGAMLAGITGLTFRQDGSLYAISQNTNGLYTIDTNTAVATRIGTVDLELHGGDLTFDGSDRLWIWSNIGPGAGLYELDPVTAQASAFDIVPDLSMAGMSAVGHGDNMQAGSSSDSHLYEISPVLGLTGNSIQFSLGGAPFSYKRGDMDSPFCEGDEVCDDGDPCTADVCTPGGCQHPPATDGTACDDGDACTQADGCQSGVCVGADPVTCAAQDACHVAGICDPAIGACSNPAAADGTPCDDGNACTQNESCLAGSCQGGTPTDLDGDSHVALICGGDDCSDTNPLVWAPPVEVAHLTIGASGSSSLSWDSQTFLAGPETVYDLVSGSFTGDAGFSFLSSTSLEDGGGNTYTDSRSDPSSGEGFWYLARGRNSCGTGSFGTFQRDSNLTPNP